MNSKDKRLLFIIENKMKCGEGINQQEYETVERILTQENMRLIEEININKKRLNFLKNNVGGYDGCKDI